MAKKQKTKEPEAAPVFKRVPPPEPKGLNEVEVPENKENPAN